MAMKAKNTGMVILGGGLIKHHICNANLMVIFFISIELRFEIFFELIIFFLFFREMVQILVFLLTLPTNSMGQTAVPDLTRQYPGVKLEEKQNQSR